VSALSCPSGGSLFVRTQGIIRQGWGEALKKAQGVSKVVTLKRGASRWPEVEGWWYGLANQGLDVANER
jgi:hypothetical protein